MYAFSSNNLIKIWYFNHELLNFSIKNSDDWDNLKIHVDMTLKKILFMLKSKYHPNISFWVWATFSSNNFKF